MVNKGNLMLKGLYNVLTTLVSDIALIILLIALGNCYIVINTMLAYLGSVLGLRT